MLLEAYRKYAIVPVNLKTVLFTCKTFLDDVRPFKEQLSNRPHSLSVYRRNNPSTRFVNHEPKASDFNISLGYYAGKPIESAVYCFYKITLKCFSFLWVYWYNKR